MSRADDMEFMDIDGPEFLSDVNNQIANIRANYNERHDAVSSDIFDNSNVPTHIGQYAGLEAYNEICVLDTNFLISKLGYLDTVLDLAEANPGSLLVLLPWVVIRELDGLKTSKSSSDPNSESEICTRARRAMRFVELRLREKSISLRGQKMYEILDPVMSNSHNVKGDDRILDCCMYFQHMTGKRVTLLSNDRNLCIKVMVHEVDSISAESVPKMEALLNRIALNGREGKRESVYSTHNSKPRIPSSSRRKWSVSQRQAQPATHTTATTEDYVMEIDEFYPNNNNIAATTATHYGNEEDYDMMIDDDEVYEHKPAPPPLESKGSNESRWAKAPRYTNSRRSTLDEVPAYLDNDPTLVAPRKSPQNLSYSNSNHVPINKDASWTSIYSPR